MSFALECTKIKRTGFVPAFVGGGLLSAAVPVLNMAFRAEMYVGRDSSPVDILLDANWQMMTMLNVLLVVTGACIMYNTEYADNAIQRMCMLPITENKMFFAKAVVMTVTSIMVLVMEAASVFYCSEYWFGQYTGLYVEVLKNFAFLFLLMLPAIRVSLLIAAACKNMWISLGIGVLCIFTATMLPAQNFVLSLFPFALPFQTLSGKAADMIGNYVAACLAEIVIIAVLEVVFLKVRRMFE